MMWFFVQMSAVKFFHLGWGLYVFPRLVRGAGDVVKLAKAETCARPKPGEIFIY